MQIPNFSSQLAASPSRNNYIPIPDCSTLNLGGRKLDQSVVGNKELVQVIENLHTELEKYLNANDIAQLRLTNHTMHALLQDRFQNLNDEYEMKNSAYRAQQFFDATNWVQEVLIASQLLPEEYQTSLQNLKTMNLCGKLPNDDALQIDLIDLFMAHAQNLEKIIVPSDSIFSEALTRINNKSNVQVVMCSNEELEEKIFSAYCDLENKLIGNPEITYKAIQFGIKAARYLLLLLIFPFLNDTRTMQEESRSQNSTPPPISLLTYGIIFVSVALEKFLKKNDQDIFKYLLGEKFKHISQSKENYKTALSRLNLNPNNRGPNILRKIANIDQAQLDLDIEASGIRNTLAPPTPDNIYCSQSLCLVPPLPDRIYGSMEILRKQMKIVEEKKANTSEPELEYEEKRLHSEMEKVENLKQKLTDRQAHIQSQIKFTERKVKDLLREKEAFYNGDQSAFHWI